MRFQMLSVIAVVALMAAATSAQVKKSEMPGVRNYSRVDATVGCGGAVDPSAMSALKKEGYVSVINLRLANEAVFIRGNGATVVSVDFSVEEDSEPASRI